jgi:hypothetical protein
MIRNGATALITFACWVASSTGCAVKDGDPPESNSGNGGASGAGGSETAGTGAAGKGAAGNATGGSAGDGTAGDGAAGDGAAGDGGAGFSEVGVCGHRGESTVTDTEFSGFEEYFLIGEEGFGDDICVVRFDVERSGDPPSECPDCEWSHAVRLSNPTVVLDTNGVCENSELGLGAAEIAELDGSERAYGFVDEFAGHVSVLLKYDEEDSVWDAFGAATYDPEESTLKFESRNGFCNYRP